MARIQDITVPLHLEASVSTKLTDNVGSMEDRIAGLREAKSLLLSGGTGDGGVTSALFGKSTPNKGGDQYPEPMPLMRLATFIVTGHDYRDTHPEVEALVIDGGLTEKQVRKIVKRQMREQAAE